MLIKGQITPERVYHAINATHFEYKNLNDRLKERQSILETLMNDIQKLQEGFKKGYENQLEQKDKKIKHYEYKFGCLKREIFDEMEDKIF